MATSQSTATFCGVPLDEMEARLLGHLVRVPSGCWEWDAYRTKYGYGKIASRKHPTTFAHRVAYAVFCGPIPDGLFVCHRCDNPPCCNPTHLFLGTHEDNMRDCKRKGRTARGPRLPQTKLTDELREIIRREHRPYDRTASVPVLAKRHGVSVRTVYRALGY